MANTPETDRLRTVVDLWRGVQDKLQPSISVSGGSIETVSIGNSLDQIADVVEQIEIDSVDPITRSVQWPNVASQIGSLENYIRQIVNNGGAHHVFQSQAQNIVNSIWSLRSALVWCSPYSATNGQGVENPRLAELVASAKKVLDLRRKAGDAEHELQGILDELHKGSERAKNLIVEIEGSERTASNARTNTEASETTTKQVADALQKLLDQDTERSESLKRLLDEFQKKKTDVDATLEGASKVALANSFQTRRQSLNRERWGWVIGFGVGILVMSGVGGYVAPAILNDLQQSGPSRYLEMIGHFLIIGPLLWATWFCARKSGQTMRLAEDYAFKEAAAHSFVGYKREMGDDADMLHQLRDNAIRNFGADPLRVLSNEEAASPLHDVFNKLLDRVDKLKPEEAMKALGEIAKAVGNVQPGNRG